MKAKGGNSVQSLSGTTEAGTIEMVNLWRKYKTSGGGDMKKNAKGKTAKMKLKPEEMRMLATNKEILSLGAFVRFYEQHASKIKTTRIIPPRLGEKSFGKIEVTYHRVRHVPLEVF